MSCNGVLSHYVIVLNLCHLAFNCDVGKHVLSIRSELQFEMIRVITFRVSVPLHSNLSPQ